MAANGILSDTAILKAMDFGEIIINPFRQEQLNPASYDITLGEEVAVYTECVDNCQNLNGAYSDGHMLMPKNFSILPSKVLDAKLEPKITKWRINKNDGIMLKPGIGYLMHAQETVCSNVYNPIIDGKSSIARLFIQIHSTAGFGDVGFNGQFTLEVSCLHPVRIYPGMRIGQIRFQSVVGKPRKLYNEVGHYVGDNAMGARPSQAWKQFEESKV